MVQREEHGQELDVQDFVRLFAATVSWKNANGEQSVDVSGVMQAGHDCVPAFSLRADVSGKQAILNHAMAACLAASVMELASEDKVKARLDLASHKRLPKTMEVIVDFLETGNKVRSALIVEDLVYPGLFTQSGCHPSRWVRRWHLLRVLKVYGTSLWQVWVVLQLTLI